MGMVMGMRGIRSDLEGWQLDLAGVRSRMYLAPTPRERERWHALWLLCRGLTASATAQALGRDAHTIGRWAAAFGEGGPAALIFEQTGGFPPALGETQQAELTGAVQELPEMSGIEMANWNWKVVRQRHSGPLGVIWDNAPAHRGEAVREYLRMPGLGLRLMNPRFHEGRLCRATARTEAPMRPSGAGRERKPPETCAWEPRPW